MYFDSHAHLDSDCFDTERDEILADLKNHNISLIMNVGCDLASSECSVALAEQYPFVYAGVGTHPDDAANLDDRTLNRYRALCANPRVRAIGEIGLDYHYETVPRAQQIIAFERQLALAQELDMPVIVHQRDAHDDALAVIAQFPGVRGVFHCFSGAAPMALWLVARGWYIGFTGVVTFKNARKPAEVVRALPMDRILIETDCPYMTPEPYRGKRNDSRYLPYIAEKIAELRGLSPETVGAQTADNARRLFRIDPLT